MNREKEEQYIKILKQLQQNTTERAEAKLNGLYRLKTGRQRDLNSSPTFAKAAL